MLEAKTDYFEELFNNEARDSSLSVHAWAVVQAVAVSFSL